MTLQSFKKLNEDKLITAWYQGGGLEYKCFESFCFAQWQEAQQ